MVFWVTLPGEPTAGPQLDPPVKLAHLPSKTPAGGPVPLPAEQWSCRGCVAISPNLRPPGTPAVDRPTRGVSGQMLKTAEPPALPGLLRLSDGLLAFPTPLHAGAHRLRPRISLNGTGVIPSCGATFDAHAVIVSVMSAGHGLLQVIGRVIRVHALPAPNSLRLERRFVILVFQRT